MMGFWMIAAAMLAVGLLFVVLPLARTARSGEADRTAMNLALYRDEFIELDADLADGSLSPEQYRQAKDELERRVLEDAQPEDTTTATGGNSRVAAIAVGVLVPVLAVLLYLDLGNLDGLDPAKTVPEMAQAGDAHGPSGEQIQAMVTSLAERLKANPDDAEGWVMLARSLVFLQRFQEALPAFEQALRLVKNDANLLTDYADILAMAQGRKLDGRPVELIHQALAIKPDHQKGLALAGTFEFDRGNYAGAVDYWGRLLRTVQPGSEQARSIQAGIDEAQAMLGIGGDKAPRIGAGGSVQGRVILSDKLRDRVQPGDTLFVFARAANGPKMPLAIVRSQANQLPLSFSLDDSMAMAPNMKLSSFDQVVVGARISRSGKATPETGDLEGQSQPVKIGASGIEVLIDQIAR